MVSGTVTGLCVFCCTIPIVCPRQSMSASRRLTMSHARRPVVNASRVIAASRAAITPDAHARTTRHTSWSDRTGRAGWERRTPASRAASTRSVRPVKVKNGRKFDTTQNNEDLAHLPDSDSRNPPVRRR